MSGLNRNLIGRPILNALLGFAVILGVVANVRAEKWVSVGDYQIHYNAVYSLDLTAAVARATQLPRGRNYSWIIISVRHNADGLNRDATAHVQGDATNLLGQRVALDFKHIKEDGGQYYIAPLRFSEGDLFRFSIAVNPESSQSSPKIIEFQQRYRVDNPR